MAWSQNSTTGSGNCTGTDSATDEGILLGSDGLLVCRVGCNGTLGSLSYVCNDFSTIDLWAAGKRTYRYEIGTSLKCTCISPTSS